MLFRFTRLKCAVCTHFFVMVLLALAAPPSFAATGKLLLQLRDATTQRPVDNSQVTLAPREGQPQTTIANTLGEATFEGLPSGLYSLEVQNPRYQTLRLPSVRITHNKTTPITLPLIASKNSIEEVLVVGTAIIGDNLKSAGTSQMNREALRSAAGSGSDVLRALDGLPGLFSDGEYSSYSVRGNGPRDNLITVDGIPFANVVHFSDSFGEQEEIEGGGRYSVFAPNIINSAKFQPGGWSSAYGGRAGSLLELEVAQGNPETASYTTRLDLAGIEVGYDGPMGIDGSSILFSARQLNFGRLFETIGMEDVGTPKLTDIIVKTHSQLGDDDSLNFLIIHAPEEYQRDIDNVLASDEDDPGNYEDVEIVDSESDNTLLAATWSRLVGSTAELTSQVYYRNYAENSTSGEAYPDLVPEGTAASEIPQRANIITSHRDETELGFRLDFATDNALGRLTTGARVSQLDLDFGLSLDDNWIRYSFDQNDYRPDPNQQYIELTPEAVDNLYQNKATQYALYADQEWSWGSVDWRAGARFDKDNFSDQNLWSPRFASTWHAGAKTLVTMTAGRYYQAPRFSDRASDDSNSTLENEIVDQVSLGLQYNLNENMDIFIETYYQDLSKLIATQDGVNQTLANTGQGESYGVDTAISRHFSKGWSASFTYSYNHAQVQDQPDTDFYDADFSRPHAASIGGVWEINSRCKLSGRWKWASGKATDSFIIHENVLGDGNPYRYSKEITATNTERYDSFNALNFRVDYQRAFGRLNVIAFLDVINALGAENPSTSEFNERTGKDVIEAGESIPLIGLRFTW